MDQLTLLTNDGASFDVPLHICKHFETILGYLEEDNDVDTIPLPNVSSTQLKYIVDYFASRTDRFPFHTERDPTDDERAMMTTWSNLYFHHLQTPVLLDLLATANYLNCDAVIECVCALIASRIAGKSREEMREILGIENDFTPDEEERMIAETLWAF